MATRKASSVAEAVDVVVEPIPAVPATPATPAVPAVPAVPATTGSLEPASATERREPANTTVASYSFLSKLYSLLRYLPNYFSNLFRSNTAVINTVSTK